MSEETTRYARRQANGKKDFVVILPSEVNALMVILAKLKFLSQSQYMRNAIVSTIEADMKDPSMKRKVNRELAKVKNESN